RIVIDGLVEGGTAAILAASNGVAPIAIDNLAGGTLQNMDGLSTGLAVQTSSGPTALTNAGTLRGVLQFGPGAGNTLVNEGLWDTAGGVSDFGGAAIVTNAAGGAILAGGSGAAVTTTFGGLTRFDNDGRLILAGAALGNALETDADIR